jgi:hypothetical protein
MFAKVGEIAEAYPDWFDYSQENLQWVDSDNLGPRLVREINCRAQSSLEQGGLGKVIIVGHSMGGLAARWAANNGAADSIGMVVTVGTPNLGSILGNTAIGLALGTCQAFTTGAILQVPAGAFISGEICSFLLRLVPQLDAIHGLSKNSPELAALGWVPQNIPVVAIGGNVQWQFRTFLGTISAPPSNGDLVVSTESALHGAERHVVDCSGFVLIPMLSDAPCEHSRQINHPIVQQRVVDSIRQYVQNSSGPACLSLPDASDLVASAYASPIYQGASPPTLDAIECHGDWAIAAGRSDAVSNYDGFELFQLQQGTWAYVGKETYYGGNICSQFPDAIRQRVATC